MARGRVASVNEVNTGENDIVILRKVNKITEVFGNKPVLKKTKSLSPNSEEKIEGTYEGNSIIGVKSNLSPIWDKATDSWAFNGDFQTLLSLAKKMKLKDKDGNIILPNEDSIYDDSDKFFTHISLYNKKWLIEGVAVLNPNDPFEQFFKRVEEGYSRTVKPGEIQSKVMMAGAQRELYSEKLNVQTEAKVVDKQVKAITYLGNMSYDKQKAIAYIMSPPSFNPANNDPDTLKVLLYDTVVTNSEQRQNKFDNMSFQERFIQLAEMSDDKIHINATVKRGLDKGIITRNSEGWRLKGNLLKGVASTEMSVFNYFLDPENHEDWFVLDKELNPPVETKQQKLAQK